MASGTWQVASDRGRAGKGKFSREYYCTVTESFAKSFLSTMSPCTGPRIHVIPNKSNESTTFNCFFRTGFDPPTLLPLTTIDVLTICGSGHLGLLGDTLQDVQGGSVPSPGRSAVHIPSRARPKTADRQPVRSICGPS